MLIDTKILTNNEWVNVQDLKAGDLIQGVRGLTKIVKIGETKTRTLAKLNDELIVSTLQGFIDANGNTLFLNQRLDRTFSDTEYIAIKESLLIYFDGTLRSPEAVEFIELQESEPVYYLATEDGSFYANGYVVTSWEPCDIETYLKDIEL